MDPLPERQRGCAGTESQKQALAMENRLIGAVDDPFIEHCILDMGQTARCPGPTGLDTTTGPLTGS